MQQNSTELIPQQKAEAVKKFLQKHNLWKESFEIKPSSPRNSNCLGYYLSPVSYEEALSIYEFLLDTGANVPHYHRGVNHFMRNGQGTITLLYSMVDHVAEFTKSETRKRKKPTENFSTDKKQGPAELYIPVLPLERDEVHFGPIYADENGVYCFVPIMNGDPIGTDNTCKSLLAIRAAFGEQNGAEPIKNAIARYIRHLQFELSMFNTLTEDLRLSYGPLIHQKQNRLRQLKLYQELFNEMGNHHGVDFADKSFPEHIQQLIGSKQNYVSISLSPAEEDANLGVDPQYALFSAARAPRPSNLKCSSSGLGFELRKMLSDVNTKLMDRKPQGIRDIIIQKAGKKYLKYVENQKVEGQKQEPLINSDIANDNDLDFLKNCVTEAYADFLKECVPEFYSPFVAKMPDEKSPERKKWDPLELNSAIANHDSGAKAFVLVNETEKKPIAVNLSYFTEMFGVTDAKGLSGSGFAVTDWASYLLNATVPDVTFSELEKKAKTSPFNAQDEGRDKEIDKFSRRCQMFLAAINIFCHAKHLSSENFGKVIEKNAQLCTNLMGQIQHAINDGLSIEDTIFAIINNSVTNNNPFRLSQPLGEDEQNKIKEQFHILYNTSLESPHDDEYLFFLDEREGPFYSIHNMIALPLSDFMRISEEKNPALKPLREKFFATSPSASSPLPLMPDSKDHHVVKKGLNPQDFIFQVNLTALLSDTDHDPSDFIALVLTTRVPGTGRKLFDDEELITEEHQQQLINSKWWPDIRKKVLKELSGRDLNEFLCWKHPKEIANTTSTALIPRKMEEWLYSYVREKTGNDQALVGYSGTEKVRQAFQCLAEIKESEEKEFKPIHLNLEEITPSHVGGYLVTFANQEQKAFTVLQKEFQKSRLKLHIPRLMAKSLYCEVTRLGHEVPTIPTNLLERFKKSHYEAKMKTVFETVGCRDAEVTPLEDWNGYSAQLKRLEDLDTVNGIYHNYLRSDHMCAIKLSLKDCQKLCGDSKQQYSIEKVHQELMKRIAANRLDILVGSMEIIYPSISRDSKDSKEQNPTEPYIRLVVENDIKSSQRKQGLAAIALMLTESNFSVNQIRNIGWEKLTPLQITNVETFYQNHQVKNPFLTFTPITTDANAYVGPQGSITVGLIPPSSPSHPHEEEKEEKEEKLMDKVEVELKPSKEKKEKTDQLLEESKEKRTDIPKIKQQTEEDDDEYSWRKDIGIEAQKREEEEKEKKLIDNVELETKEKENPDQLLEESKEKRTDISKIKQQTEKDDEDSWRKNIGIEVQKMEEEEKEKKLIDNVELETQEKENPDQLLEESQNSSAALLGSHNKASSSSETMALPPSKTQLSLSNPFILTRITMLAAFSGLIVWSLIEEHSLTFLILGFSLSHWNLVFATIHQGLELLQVYLAERDADKIQAIKENTQLAKFRAVGLNVSLMITGSFWIDSLLNNPHLNGVSYLNILTHSLPALFYLADILANRLLFPPAQNKWESVKNHCLPIILFALAYLIFDAAYAFLGGKPEQSQEDYLATLFNWQQNPLAATLHSFLGITALLGLTTLTTLLINARYSTKPVPNTSTKIISGSGMQGQFAPHQKSDPTLPIASSTSTFPTNITAS